MNMNEINKWLVDKKDTIFEWGVSDCCLFTCDYVLFVSGIDPATSHRGHYSTSSGSLRALKKYGSVESSFDKHFDRVDIGFATRGDVVYYESDLGHTLGIKWGNGVYTIGMNGCTIVSVDEDRVIGVWRVIK